MESKLNEYATTINELVDAHTDCEEDIDWIKVKLVALEDRSRRNNVKGENSQIGQTSGLSDFLPDVPSSELINKCIHHLPKPPNLPDKCLRDTIVWIHFYHIKERLLWATESQRPHLQSLICPNILLGNAKTFPLLLSPYTTTEYQWGHPVILIITKGGKSHIIRSLEEGLNLLRNWHILDPPDHSRLSNHTSWRIEPEWSMMGHSTDMDT